MILKYENDLNWTLPLLGKRPGMLQFLVTMISAINLKNPIKCIYGTPNRTLMKNSAAFSNFYNAAYTRLYGIKSQFDLTYKTEDALFFLEKNFKNLVLYATQNESEIILSWKPDAVLRLKNEINNLKILFSGDMQDLNVNSDFYNEYTKQYDRVILSPAYVKNNFKNEYKNFEDISKIEIIVNYFPEIKEEFRISDTNNEDISAYQNFLFDNIDCSYVLDKDEMEFLIKDVGIKNFRIYQNYENFGDLFDKIMSYMFESTGLSGYITTSFADKVMFNKIF